VVAEGEAAWPNDAAGGGSVVGAAVSYGRNGMQLRGALARVAPDGADASTGWAALGRVALLESKTSPFRVGAFAGVGGVRVASGPARATTYRVPLGLDAGIVVPTPVLVLDAWLAPRLDLATESPFTSKRLGARAGVAFGLGVALLNGLGLRASYDRVLLDTPDASTFGLGLYYRLTPGF
jgi:hypothetical protein